MTTTKAADATAGLPHPASDDHRRPNEHPVDPIVDPVVDPVEELAGHLAITIGRLNRSIRPTAGGLSQGLVSALATIVHDGPLRLGELAAAESVAAPTITRVFADLEGRGLVRREVDPSDRRSFLVEATDAGVELLLRARGDRARSLASLLVELAPDDLDRIRAALAPLDAAAR